MKKLFLLSLLCSPMAFASLKLNVRPQYHMHQEKVGALVGANLYEKLFSQIGINVWGGLGYRPGYGSEKGTMWYATNAKIEYYMGKWAFGPGAQFRYSPTFNDNDNSFSIDVSYKVW
jgi:hypothetical protein